MTDLVLGVLKFALMLGLFFFGSVLVSEGPIEDRGCGAVMLMVFAALIMSTCSSAVGY